MNQKRLFLFLMTAVTAGFVACNSAGDSGTTNDTAQNTSDNTATSPDAANPKGIGKYQNVELTHPLDENMVKGGQNVYEVKCASCHKLTDERLVGPGFAKVTDRRTPEWIMNFITNVDEMLDKDPEAQAMLELCMVRMPNQNLNVEEARAVLEFMRKNDGKN